MSNSSSLVLGIVSGCISGAVAAFVLVGSSDRDASDAANAQVAAAPVSTAQLAALEQDLAAFEARLDRLELPPAVEVAQQPVAREPLGGYVTQRCGRSSRRSPRSPRRPSSAPPPKRSRRPSKARWSRSVARSRSTR